MRIMAVVFVACVTLSLCFGQSSSSSSPAAASAKYQPAQVMAVKVHQPIEDKDSRLARYDVTVRVGETEYVVLYTPPEGIDVVEYQLGRTGMVLVGPDSLKWFDILNRPREAPILRRRVIPPKTTAAK